MLQQVCAYLNNFFIAKDDGVPRCWRNTYTISGNAFTPSVPLKEGQRFMIIGSDLNDGVYTFHESSIKNDDDKAAAGLNNEVFYGTVCAMSIPADFQELVTEIQGWNDKYSDAVAGPYASETVNGVYTYTKAVKSEDMGGGAYGWQDVYKNRLKQWRKLCL